MIGTVHATFYNQILRPLVQLGLVCLQQASHSKQEMNLIVHSFPSLPPEQTESSIMTDQPISESSSDMKSGTDGNGLSSASSIAKQPDDSKEKNEPQTQYTESTVLEDTPTYNVSQESENHSQPPLNFQPKRKPKTFHKTSKHKTENPLLLHSDSGTNLHPTFDSLPPLIQQTIREDQRLVERSTEIIQAYLQCHHHPGYDEIKFNKKMLTCLEYPYVKKENFGAYLLKALLNEWNAKPSVSSTSSRSHSNDTERLLRELGEWPE